MLLKRIIQEPKGSFFLLGPRGTGKSTWLRVQFPKAHFINLLHEDVYQRLLANPAQFALEVRAVPRDKAIVVDEVQRLPNLLNEVHRFIEEEKRRFVLCGSSARKLKRAGVNLLAGRAAHRAMHPFLPEELGEHFELGKALRFGLVPLVFGAEDRRETLESYCQLYLKEEIQAEALVRNLPGFARFLPIASIFHGQVINVSNIAREAGVARTTIADYLDILEETLLCFRLPAFEAKLRVRERKLPKLFWCDPGIVRAVKKSSGDLVPEERGALFEGLVAQLIRSYRDYRRTFEDFYYWAPANSSQVEVDFLLDYGGKFVAVEVKSGKAFAQKWCKGLRAIKELKGLRRRLVVYPEGPTLVTDDGIEVVQFTEFSQMLAENAL